LSLALLASRRSDAQNTRVSEMSEMAVKQRLFTIEETAKIVKRSVPSIWRDIAAGRIWEVVRMNGSTRITGESIDRACTPTKAAE
jgi:hypothetical protein